MEGENPLKRERERVCPSKYNANNQPIGKERTQVADKEVQVAGFAAPRQPYQKQNPVYKNRRPVYARRVLKGLHHHPEKAELGFA